MPTKRLLVEKKRDAFITKTDAELRKQDFSKDSIKNYKFHVGRYIDDQGVTVAKTTKKGLLTYFKKSTRGKSRAFALQTSAALDFFFKYVVEKPNLRGVPQEFLKHSAKK